MAGKVNIYKYVILVLSIIFLSAPLSAKAETLEGNLGSGATIVETWPKADVELNVPPREFKIVLDSAKDTRNYKAFIQKSSEEYPVELGRVTKGEASIIYFSAPLLTPGSYKVTWESPAGASDLQFTILEPVLAPGGGNHRHEFALNLKKFEDNAYTILLFLIVFMLLAVNLRVKPVFTILVAVAGIIFTSVLLGKSLYSSYESKGALSNELWESLAGNDIWSYILVIALITLYPFVYYLTSTVFRSLWGVSLTLLYAGKNFGHPSIPYFETFVTESLVILSTAFLLTIFYNKIFINQTYSKILKINTFSIAINKSVVTYIIVAVTALLNFTSYSGFGVPYGLFASSLVSKTLALLLIGLILLFSKVIVGKPKAIKVLVFILMFVACGILTISPPLAAGI